MNIKQHNLNQGQPTIVVSAPGAVWMQVLRTVSRFVALATESMAYGGGGIRVAYPALSPAACGFGKLDMIVDHPVHPRRF